MAINQEPQRFLYEGSWPLGTLQERLPNLIDNSNTSTSLVSRRSHQTLLTREFINSTEEDNLQPLIINYSNTSSSSSSNSTKQKAINFQVFKIMIGQWTRVAVYPDDIMAKFYVQKKKIIWEMIDPEEPGNMERMKKKIEISWDDVSSFRTQFHARDQTEILEVELTKPPTFFEETDRLVGKPTRWKQVDQDFTQNQSSICRRHILYFHPGVLQENLKKLLSGHSFWSELIKVTFPFHKSTCFDNSYGSTNNINNSPSYNHGQALSLNDNNVNLLHHSQGLDEGNIQMARQVSANNGRQINPYGHVSSWNNTPNELRVTQWSSEMINEGYNMARRSQISNLMNEDESERQYMGEIPYGQADYWNNTPNGLRGTKAITPSSQMINGDYSMINGSQISIPINQDEIGTKYMYEIPYGQANVWNNIPNELRGIEAITQSSQMMNGSHSSNLMNQGGSGILNGQANVWNNIPNELRGIEAITPSSQMINQDYNMIKGSQISNPMNEDESERQYMKENPYLAKIVCGYESEKKRICPFSI